MDSDAVVKLVLALSVGFSLVIISIQIARVFGGVADLLKDLKRVTTNIGSASDLFLKDYEMIHQLLANVTKFIEGIAGVVAPIALISNWFKKEQHKAEATSSDIV
jgi:hypothetical protein